MPKTIDAKIVDAAFALVESCNDMSNADLAKLSPRLRDAVVRLRRLFETKGHS